MTSGALLRVPATASGGRASSAPAIFAPVLDTLSAESRLHFGTDTARLEPVSYFQRPFSHVLKVAVFTRQSNRPDTHLFVKIFKAGAGDTQRMTLRVARDFETTSRIHAALSRHADLAAVRAVACYPERLAMVTEEAPGRTLLAALQKGTAWLVGSARPHDLPSAMGRVGRWLRAFQLIAPPPGEVSLDGLRAYVDLRLRRLTQLPASSMSADDRRRVLAHIDRLAAEVDPVDLAAAPIHGDLAPGNILVTEGRVTVLDFAMFTAGSRLHDLARLVLQVQLMALKPHVRSGLLQRLNLSLMQGFDPGLHPSRPMFRLLLLQHRVNHLATLTVTREAFPSSVYNWHIRRSHRAWIARELATPGRSV